MARFRSARSAKEEQCLLKRATPRSTRYETKWAGRQMKEVNSAEDGLDDDRPIQPLTASLEEMHITSLAFWFSKFSGEAANSKG